MSMCTTAHIDHLFLFDIAGDAGLEEPALRSQEVQSASRQGGFEAAAKKGECGGGGLGSVFQS